MQYFAVMQQSPLFAGMHEADLAAMLKCLLAVHKPYEKNSYVLMAGERVSSIGMVLSGSVHVVQHDFWGNRTLLMQIGPGGLFGEALVCAGVARMPVSVVAAERANILLLDYRRIITSCTSACVFHARLIENMLGILARKNVALTQKIEHIAKRTIRQRLLSFLSTQALAAGSSTFEIALNRQELAEYLSVDRSALSTELGKMRSEGIVAFDRNRFTLLKEDT